MQKFRKKDRGYLAPFLVLFFAVFLCPMLRAAPDETGGPYVGFLGGVDKISDASSNITVIGANMGTRKKGYGISMFYLTGSKNVTYGARAVAVKLTHVLYGVEPAMFWGKRLNAHLGLKVGSSNTTVTASAGGLSASGSANSFAAGPSAGFDYRIYPSFSAGIEVSYLRVMATNPYNVMLSLLALKYYF